MQSMPIRSQPNLRLHRCSWHSLRKCAVQEFKVSQVGSFNRGIFDAKRTWTQVWTACSVPYVTACVPRGSACSPADELICVKRSITLMHQYTVWNNDNAACYSIWLGDDLIWLSVYMWVHCNNWNILVGKFCFFEAGVRICCAGVSVCFCKLCLLLFEIIALLFAL